MGYKITCPYCFHEMADHEVLFRSERVSIGEFEGIPDAYDDIQDFISRYSGGDKERIIKEYREWDFFRPGMSGAYMDFWNRFGGTTEKNPADRLLGVKAYERRVIDPGEETHRRYIKLWGTDPLIRDDQSMVSQIELKSGERCHRRVCPRCHNPFPDNYGKSSVKFVTIIGITGAGKTVYVSQLLKSMRDYCARVGLSAIVTSPSVVNFITDNSVRAKSPLPGSTPAQSFQQPLFYEIIKGGAGSSNATETFVLYDVAGEVFTDQNLISRFAPFVENTDGVIALIDPFQFQAVSEVSETRDRLSDPEAVFDAIHYRITRGVQNKKCAIPFAVCMSKADMEDFQKVMPAELRMLLRDNIPPVLGPEGEILPVFNASSYNPIGMLLDRFISSTEFSLSILLKNNYSAYSYFAFTALGCDVEEYENAQGERYPAPKGPIITCRLQEPMLWLFNRLGYIGVNERLYSPAVPIVYCPACGSDETEGMEKTETSGVLMFKKTIRYNRRCRRCQQEWWNENI